MIDLRILFVDLFYKTTRGNEFSEPTNADFKNAIFDEDEIDAVRS